MSNTIKIVKQELPIEWLIEQLINHKDFNIELLKEIIKNN